MDAAIFPGQGAQLVGMGRDVADAYTIAAETFAEADEILGFGLSALCFDGPAERLNATDIQQPAIFTTSVALFRAALDAGRFKFESFGAMGGLSLGEYTALHLAEAISFADALRLGCAARAAHATGLRAERRRNGLVDQRRRGKGSRIVRTRRRQRSRTPREFQFAGPDRDLRRRGGRVMRSPRWQMSSAVGRSRSRWPARSIAS